MFNASGQPVHGRPKIWTTRDTTIAIVDSMGVVTAMASGVVAVVATLDNGADSVMVTVSGPVVPFDVVSANWRNTCGITSAGSTYCWGLNSSGQLGDGSLVNSNTPDLVSGGHVFDSLSGSTQGNCALTAGGQAFCWGQNTDGQIGDSTTSTNRIVPTAVSGSLIFDEITYGWDEVCGLQSGGRIYCWGRGAFGALGDSTTASRTYPDSVFGGLRFLTVENGLGTNCGVTVSNAAYCWGRNNNGQLGIGATGDKRVPTAVTGTIMFKQISVGGDVNGGSTCGVDVAGVGYCWGLNKWGQVGDGTTTTRLVPVPVSGGHTWQKIEAGSFSACGLTTAGRIYCWGYDGNGALGNDAALVTTHVPVPVFGPRMYTDVSITHRHACGLAASGALYCWGENSKGGELGDGTRTRRPTPVRVKDPS